MNKKLIASLIAIVMVVVSITYSPFVSEKVSADDRTPFNSGWELKWSDEFDGNNLSLSNWNVLSRDKDKNKNQELQYYRSNYVSVSDGCLKILAQKNGSKYFSGRIDSRRKQYFEYGKMEARIKVENGNQEGLWPAFWMQGNDRNDDLNDDDDEIKVGWPACGEIDIMEHANCDDYTEGTLHWGTDSNHVFHRGSHNSGTNPTDYIFSEGNGIDQWHTYGIIWDKDLIKWYVDGNVYYEDSIGVGSDMPDYFNKSYYFLLNLAVGGEHTGYTNDLPNGLSDATMMVDYVRAYQYTKQTTGDSIQMNQTIGSNETIDAGDYKVQGYDNANDCESYVGVDANKQSHIAINCGGNISVTKEFPELTNSLKSGTNYKVYWPITFRGKEGSVDVLGYGSFPEDLEIALGNNTPEGYLTVDRLGYSEATAFIKLNQECIGKTIEIRDPIIKDEDGNIVYPNDGVTEGFPSVIPATTTSGFDLTHYEPSENNEDFTVGNFGLYLSNKRRIIVDAGIDPNDSNHLRIYYDSASDQSEWWKLKPSLTLTGLDASTKYDVSWKIKTKSRKAIKTNFYMPDEAFKLNGGVNTLVGSKNSDSKGKLSVSVGLCALSVDTTIDLYDLVITKHSDGQQVYPVHDEPTAAPMVEPTVAPTTTQTPTTTVAPTTTTVAPTEAPVESTAEETTVNQGETESTNEFNMTEYSGSADYDLGGYKLTLRGTKVEAGISNNNPNHMKFKYITRNTGNGWYFKVFKYYSIRKENSYRISWKVKSNKSGTIFVNYFGQYSLQVGENVIEAEVYNKQLSEIALGFALLPANAVLEVYDLSITRIPNPTTTETPTTTQEPTTTVEPTTTQEQTTQVDPADIQYDVSMYGDDDEEMGPYPEKDGMIFAGWYTDKTYKTPFLEDEGMAYAKFIDRNVLTVKLQTKGTEAVRFLSSLDSLDYKEVGFIVRGKYGDHNISTVKNVKNVYTSVFADGERTLPSVFCNSSNYFFTYTIRGMDGNVAPNEWDITPYYITLDGTQVLGTSRFQRFK